MRYSHTTTLQLDRSDEGRALLRPWIDLALERMRMTETRSISVDSVMRGRSKITLGKEGSDNSDETKKKTS